MIEEDGDHVTSQILVATEENTVYENKLTVTGREAGQYQCTVSSNRDEFFGATGSTVTSEEFEVEGKLSPLLLVLPSVMMSVLFCSGWRAGSCECCTEVRYKYPGHVGPTRRPCHWL